MCVICYCFNRSINKNSMAVYRRHLLEINQNMDIYTIEQVTLIDCVGSGSNIRLPSIRTYERVYGIQQLFSFVYSSTNERAARCISSVQTRALCRLRMMMLWPPKRTSPNQMPCSSNRHQHHHRYQCYHHHRRRYHHHPHHSYPHHLYWMKRMVRLTTMMTMMIVAFCLCQIMITKMEQWVHRSGSDRLPCERQSEAN